MKEFTEKHHAFIAASFYAALTERFGQRGEEAFIHATIRYAEQRGSRMAQRAIRDGKELSYATYMEYGEWTSTQSVKDEGCENRGFVESMRPDYVYRITGCPWAAQFREMGMQKAGIVYCTYLDPSIVRGFNPAITFLTEQSLHDHDCCIQKVLDSRLPEGFVPEKKTQYLKGFDYHCGHIFQTFSRLSAAIFGPDGQEAADEVLSRFENTYGKDMAEVLLSFFETDFDLAD